MNNTQEKLAIYGGVGVLTPSNRLVMQLLFPVSFFEKKRAEDIKRGVKTLTVVQPKRLTTHLPVKETQTFALSTESFDPMYHSEPFLYKRDGDLLTFEAGYTTCLCPSEMDLTPGWSIRVVRVQSDELETACEFLNGIVRLALQTEKVENG